MYASRNIKLCTKDCLCLFVCPTGATNTETGQIDKDKCINGCRKCVDVCPSHAIFLVPGVNDYPEPQEKTEEVMVSLRNLMDRKADQEDLVRSILLEHQKRKSNSPELTKLLKALESSCRILAEDCARESGYMIPQAPLVKDLPGE